MKDIFKRTTNSIIVSSVIALIIGLIIAFNPTMSDKTIGIIVACYMIVYGVVLVILDVTSNKYYVPFDGIISGVLSIILGIVLIGKPDILSTVLAIMIGVWIILSSVNMIKMSISLKDSDSPWILLLLLGIFDLLVGIIVLFNPFEASISMTVFAGIMIIVHSIINIIDMVIIKKDVKKISKTIEKKLKEIK